MIFSAGYIFHIRLLLLSFLNTSKIGYSYHIFAACTISCVIAGEEGGLHIRLPLLSTLLVYFAACIISCVC